MGFFKCCCPSIEHRLDAANGHLQHNRFNEAAEQLRKVESKKDDINDPGLKIKIALAYRRLGEVQKYFGLPNGTSLEREQYWRGTPSGSNPSTPPPANNLGNTPTPIPINSTGGTPSGGNPSAPPANNLLSVENIPKAIPISSTGGTPSGGCLSTSPPANNPTGAVPSASTASPNIRGLSGTTPASNVSQPIGSGSGAGADHGKSNYAGVEDIHVYAAQCHLPPYTEGDLDTISRPLHAAKLLLGPIKDASKGIPSDAHSGNNHLHSKESLAVIVDNAHSGASKPGERSCQSQGTVHTSGGSDSVQSQSTDTGLGRLRTTSVGYQEKTIITESETVYSCAYSPDGQSFAVGLSGGDINVYKTLDWKRAWTMSGHDGDVQHVVYSPVNNEIASASQDMTVRIWNSGTGSLLHKLDNHGDYVQCVAYSPQGNEVASASDDGKVLLWNSDTGECLQTLSRDDNNREVLCVAYAPKKRQIASGCGNNVQLWDVTTGECSHVLADHSEVVNDIAYSLKGDQLASASNDRTVRLWNVETQAVRYRLYGHEDGVLCVAFSPNGDQIASGGMDRVVKLWDVKTGKCCATLSGHTGPVMCVVFSPKGKQIASSSSDATVRLWECEPDRPSGPPLSR